jgi:hypothetical protein
MTLGLLLLACSNADASPMSVISPSEATSILDLRLDRSIAGVGGIARWEAGNAQIAALGRPDQPEASVGAPDPAGMALVGSISFPDAPSGLASPSGGPAPPEHASRETLKDVLRSIATIHRREVRPSVAAPSARRTAAPADDDIDEDVSGPQRAGLAEVLLDSEIAGAMLRSLVTVKSSGNDGATFAILGAGDFVLDVSPAARAAHITELSTGVSLGTPSNYSVYSDYTASSGEGRVVRQRSVNVVRVVWEWCLDNVFSPAGVLLSTISLIVLFFWRVAQALGGRSDGGASKRLR